MKANKLRLTVTVAPTSKKRTQKFRAKAGKLLPLVCPGTETTFDEKERKLEVTGIRTEHGWHLAQTALISLAAGMDLVFSESNLDTHHPASH